MHHCNTDQHGIAVAVSNRGTTFSSASGLVAMLIQSDCINTFSCLLFCMHYYFHIVIMFLLRASWKIDIVKRVPSLNKVFIIIIIINTVKTRYVED